MRSIPKASREPDEISDGHPRVATLVVLNVVAAIVHGLAALVVGLVGFTQTDDRVRRRGLYTSAIRWNNGTLQLEPVCAPPDADAHFDQAGVLVAISLITCAFHLAYVFMHVCRRRGGAGGYAWLLREHGGNPLRWLEYGITASMMTWVIGHSFGVLDPVTLTALSALVGTTQLFGLATELDNRALDADPSDDAAQVAPVPTLRRLRWHLAGWLPFGVAWGLLSAVFVRNVAESDDAVPDLVVAIFALETLCFTLFGLTPLCQYGCCAHPTARCAPSARVPAAVVLGAETAYVCLSLVAKLLLAGLASGVLFVD